MEHQGPGPTAEHRMLRLTQSPPWNRSASDSRPSIEWLLRSHSQFSSSDPPLEALAVPRVRVPSDTKGGLLDDARLCHQLVLRGAPPVVPIGGSESLAVRADHELVFLHGVRTPEILAALRESIPIRNNVAVASEKPLPMISASSSIADAIERGTVTVMLTVLSPFFVLRVGIHLPSYLPTTSIIG